MPQRDSYAFTKMHGLGNDFVIFDARVKDIRLTRDDIRGISDRKRGVGCDQLIVIETSKNFFETNFMRIYNPDGSEAEACGNATRCVADILMREDGVDQVVVETVVGALNCSRGGEGFVTVQMGEPKLKWNEIPLSQDCDTLHLPYPVTTVEPSDPAAVSMGNPHCIFFVDNIADKYGDDAVEKFGKRYETDPLFPNKTNVEFVEVLSPNHVRMRVWERGAGITQACGSGACAVAVAAIRRGLTGRKVRVSLDGGDLFIEWPDDNAQVAMTGPVAYSFNGIINME